MTESRGSPAYDAPPEASGSLQPAPGPVARGPDGGDGRLPPPRGPGPVATFLERARRQDRGLSKHLIKAFESTLVRFLFAGALNTVFGLIVYSALALTALPTLAVVVLSNCIGIVFNFFTTGRMVFRDMSPRRLPRFVLSYGLVILANWLLIVRLSPLVGGRIIAMLIIVGPMAAFSYLLQSRFVFRNR